MFERKFIRIKSLITLIFLGLNPNLDIYHPSMYKLRAIAWNGDVVVERLRRRTPGQWPWVRFSIKFYHHGIQVGTAYKISCLSPPICVHVQLGTWLFKVYVTSVSTHCIKGSLPVKQLYTCTNSQGNNRLWPLSALVRFCGI